MEKSSEEESWVKRGKIDKAMAEEAQGHPQKDEEYERKMEQWRKNGGHVSMTIVRKR